MKQTKNPRGHIMYGNKEGYVPNWGRGLTRASTDREVQHFPQRWQSPLLSWTNYYIPWDRATLYQWIRLLYSRIKIIVNCWKTLLATR